MSDSRIADFYRLDQAGRVNALVESGIISAADAESLLGGECLLSVKAADRMIENVIGVFGLPLAVAPNFLVNDRNYVVPMVVEEPSIVAGVSGAAKLVREAGGFKVVATDPLSIGQVQVIDTDDPDQVIRALRDAHADLLARANELQPKLAARGGGARDIEYFKYRLPDGQWTVVLHVLVDTRDAMGANAVNTICEGLAPLVETTCSGTVCLRIVSNLADRALVTAHVRIPAALLGRDGFPGDKVRDGIVAANDFANADRYRAATHNKGIMNGIDAVALATGNDWRSIEAGAHAFAARDGTYRAMTNWAADESGNLVGTLTLPVKVGIVGGAQTANPAAALGLRIAGVKSAPELAGLMVAVGLAQNFAALRALVSEGIQKGHMSLHARSVAAAAGAPDEWFDRVVAGMIESGEVKPSKAVELIDALETFGDGGGEIPLLPVTDSAAPVAAAAGTAAGKVILLGEHAVVYDRHALALPIPAAVKARIEARPEGITFAIPQWKIAQRLDADAPAQGGALAVLSLIMRNFGVIDRGFEIVVQSRIPLAMGLGFSAALAVAVIRAFDRLTGRGMSNVAIENLAFECEKIAHGTPSGIDNNVATYGEPVLYSKSARTRTKPIQLAESPPLVVASSGIKASTLEQVTGVRQRFEKNRELYETIFDEIDEISLAGAIALRNRDYEKLGSMMNVCHGFLNAIGVSAPELEKMIAIARRSGAVGAKLTGAGGGGSIIALCPEKTGEVTRALQLAGYDIIRMEDRREALKVAQGE